MLRESATQFDYIYASSKYHDIFWGFQYLFKLYLNLFASKFYRRNGYGRENTQEWNTSNCSWYHTNLAETLSYGMHTLKFAMRMTIFLHSKNVGGWVAVLHVYLCMFPSRFFTSRTWKCQPRTRYLQKKDLISCGLWAITLFQTVRTHLHQCCLCTERAAKEARSVILMQRTPRLDLPSGNRCHVGRARQNIFWMLVTPFFVPDAACHVCCDVQVINRCQSPGSSEILKVRLAQSLSNPVFSWYFVIFFCTIPHPVEKELHQCQLQPHRQCYIYIYIYNKAIEQNSFLATNHVPKKHCKFRIAIWDMNGFHIIL